MDKYIKKETAIKSLLNDCLGQVSYSREDAADCIFWLDTADVVPVVHGRWEWLVPNRLVPDCMCGTCSACKVRSKYIVNMMLCPNCGAKMDGERKNETNES